MTTLCVIAIIVLAIIIYNQHGKIEELKRRMQELDYKLHYNYGLIQSLLNGEAQESNSCGSQQGVGQTDSSAQTGTAQPITHASNDNNWVPQTPIQPTYAASGVPSSAVQPTYSASGVPSSAVQPAYSASDVPSFAVQPILSGNQGQNISAQGVGVRSANSSVSQTVGTNINGSAGQVGMQSVNVKDIHKNSKKDSLERWLGLRVFNIIAALLIFVGLILMSMLDLPVYARIASMYLSSGWLITLSLVFTKKSRNYFSLGLTGCSCGALFIAIMVTHIYFHAIPDFVAFSMLAVWTALTLFISKRIDSVLLSATAHVGMALSVCFAFSMGLSADRISLPVIYQVVSIAVVVVGNIFCCRKTYRFGLIISMLVMMYSSVAMYNLLPELEASLAVVSVLFAVQLLGSSFLSYLLAVTATKLGSQLDKSANGTAKKYIVLLTHLANKAVWCVSTFINILLVFGKTFSGYSLGFEHSALRSATLILAAVAMAHTLITVVLSEKLNFSTTLANISIHFLSAMMSIALIFSFEYNAVGRNMGVSYIFLVAAAVIAVIKLTDNRKLTPCVLTLLGIDGFIMIFGGYKVLCDIGTVALGFGYMILISAMVVYAWMLQTKENRDKYFLFFKGYIYFWVNLSVISVLLWSIGNTEFARPLILAVLSAIHILMYIFSYGKGKRRILEYIIRCASATILYLDFFMIANTMNCYNFIFLNIILLVAAEGLFAVNVYEALKSRVALLQAFAGLSFTLFISSIFYGYTDVMSVGCFASTIFMASAFICIAADFKLHKNGLRIYGITIMIISVLKLVMIDILFSVMIDILFFINSSGFKMALALTLSGVICLLLHIISIKKDDDKVLKYVALGISAAILYAGFIIIGTTKNHADYILLYIILFLITAALFTVKAYDCISSNSVGLQVMAGLSFTGFVYAVVHGYSDILSMTYVASVIYMITALICIVLGFVMRAKGLRFYGLIVVILCVLKLVTIDIRAANSMARVTAFIVGGIVCFVISGIYSRIERLYNANNSSDSE